MDMIIQGLIAAATVLYLLTYVGIRRVFAHAFVVDILCTGGFVYMFAGSYAGMMTGLIAGLTLSIFLRIGRHLLGTERIAIRRRYGHILPSVFWVRSK